MRTIIDLNTNEASTIWTVIKTREKVINWKLCWPKGLLFLKQLKFGFHVTLNLLGNVLTWNERNSNLKFLFHFQEPLKNDPKDSWKQVIQKRDWLGGCVSDRRCWQHPNPSIKKNTEGEVSSNSNQILEELGIFWSDFLHFDGKLSDAKIKYSKKQMAEN